MVSFFQLSRCRDWLQSPWKGHRQHRRSSFGRFSGPVTAEVLEARTLLTTFVVDSLGDTIADDGVLTLREALVEAQIQSPGADTIEFDESLSGGTIELTSTLPFLSFHDDLTITGLGSTELTIDSFGGKIFEVQSRGAIEISGLKLTGNTSTQVTINHPSSGGFLTLTDLEITGNTRAIDSTGNLTIVNSRITGNSGASIVRVDGDLTIVNSELSENTGSALAFTGNRFTTAVVMDSAFSNNTERSAIVSSGGGSMLISNTTISSNTGGASAVFNQGNLTITNSTISGNSSNPNIAVQNTGGVFNNGTLTVIGSTIVGNRSHSLGGVVNGGGIVTNNFSGRTTTLHNSIIAGNFRGTGTIPSDIGGKAVEVTSSHNLIGDPSTSGGLINGVNGNIVGANVAAVLEATLADNGGPTLTHALLSGSPALDSGDNSRIPTGVTSDQRGFDRIVSGTVDIGAYEFGVSNTPPDANNDPNQANEVHYFSSEDASISVAAAFGLLANDTDPDPGDSFQVISHTTTASGGLVTVNPDGGFTYSPNGMFESLAAGEFSIDTFDYTIADDAGATDSAMVTITIVGENDAPVVSGPLTVTTDEDAVALSVNLLTGASDVDTSDNLNVTNLALTGGDDAGVTINGNSLDVEPSAYNHLAVGATVIITYTYEVVDGNGGSVPQTATITIEGRNDAPTGSDFSKTSTEDSPVILSAADFIGSFSDPDTSDALAEVRIDSLPTNGVLQVSGAAVTAGQVINVADLDSLVFVPAVNFNGDTSFNYSAGDSIAFSELPAMVTLDILSAAEQVALIDGKIDDLLDAGVINEGQAESLKLALKDNNGDAAKVQAFLNELDAFINGGILTEEQVEELIDRGLLLLESLETA